MLRLSLVSILIQFGLNSFAQRHHSLVSSDAIVGYNLLKKDSIHAIKYRFPKPIYKANIDTVSGLFAIQVRNVGKNGLQWKNNGEIMVFDYKTNHIKWSEPLHYNKERIKVLGNNIFLLNAGKSTLISLENGAHTWEINGSISWVDMKANIAIDIVSRNMIKGIDLKSGNAIWKRVIESEYGWNSTQMLNDSLLFIASDGVHLINTKNGLGWDYYLITGKKDNTRQIAIGAAGIALGALTGTFIIPTGPDIISGVTSNMIIDSSDVFFAGKEYIVRLNANNGKLIWATKLPQDFVSNSSIFIQNDFLYMVNNGYALKNNRTIDYGKPSLIKFNLETGMQVYLSSLAFPNSIIRDFDVKDNKITFLFDDLMLNYSLGLSSNNCGI